jgi:hypothetical protein
MRHSAALGLGIALYLSVAGLSGGLQAQTSTSQASPAGQSLGDYARQIRKEPDAKPKKKVFDNDNLPKEDKLSVVGNTPAPGAEAAAPAESKPAETANAAPAKAEGGAPPADPSKMDQAQKEAAWKQWGTGCATPAIGTSRTPSTSSRSPTNKRRWMTPSRSWKICARRPGRRAFRVRCASRRLSFGSFCSR